MRHALCHRLPTACALLWLLLAPLARADDAPRLVVLGDSISAAYGLTLADGWVALLAKRIERTGYVYRVVNASVSGETTAGALTRLPHVLQTHHPALVLVELGGNDGLRGLPVAGARANLDRIVTTIQASGAVAVVIGMRVPPNYGAAYADAFAAMYGEVARAHRAALVPFLLAPIASSDSNFQSDRIHPTAAAQPALVDVVWPVLEPLLRRPPAPPVSVAPNTKAH
jgi:acyl-CoA thioesterase I